MDQIDRLIIRLEACLNQSKMNRDKYYEKEDIFDKYTLIIIGIDLQIERLKELKLDLN